MIDTMVLEQHHHHHGVHLNKDAKEQEDQATLDTSRGSSCTMASSLSSSPSPAAVVDKSVVASSSSTSNNNNNNNKRTSLLSKIVPGFTARHRRSSATFAVSDDEDGLSSYSSSSTELYAPIPGSCLKVRTQTESLAQPYQSSHVGLDTNDDASASPSSVRFGDIEVLVFSLRLGDNPSVSVGPPLAMGDELAARVCLCLEEYESTRPPRRHKQELAVPKWIREDWLRDEGFSRGECREVEETIAKIKKSRKHNTRSALKSSSKLFLRLFSHKTTPRRVSIPRR